MIKIIDFYADWCAPCRIMSPIVEDVVGDFSGSVSLEKINVDENSSKASEYGVMSIPTFVALKDGKEVSRKVGGMSRESFKEWVASLSK